MQAAARPPSALRKLLRRLCSLAALYGFAVFGYITASFASLSVERDAASPDGSTVGTADLAAVGAEIFALRAVLAASPASRAGRVRSGAALSARSEES